VADASKSPLAGKRVVVTRAIEQTSDLNARLTAHDAIPISLPLVSFAPPADYALLDAALRQLHTFDWIIFTSANAVHAVATRAAHQRIHLAQAFESGGSRPPCASQAMSEKPVTHHDPVSSGSKESVILSASDKDARRTSTSTPPPQPPRATTRPQIAVVGPATKSEAAAAGLPTDYVAKTHLGVALAEELGDRLRDKSVFLPRSDRANPDLPAALRTLGAKLTEVIAYRTIPPDGTNHSRVNAVIDGQADAILFFSPSAVNNFAALAGRERLAATQNKTVIVAVGPITARALNDIGAHRITVAADTTAAAVVYALINHFASSDRNAAATLPSPSRAGVNRA
jgi:uroporphyrinogen-III synthase